MPRVMKLRKDGKLACNEATYVDDVHVAGQVVGEVNLTQRASERLKSPMNYYGNQAEDRKYRPVTTTPFHGPGVVVTGQYFLSSA